MTLEEDSECSGTDIFLKADDQKEAGLPTIVSLTAVDSLESKDVRLCIRFSKYDSSFCCWTAETEGSRSAGLL